MKVKATWHHVIAVTREIEVDEEAFNEWAQRTYGPAFGDTFDRDLALAEWIHNLDTHEVAEVFSDWKTNERLPDVFELQYSEVVEAGVAP